MLNPTPPKRTPVFRGTEFDEVDPSKVDFILDDPSTLFAYNVNSVPMVNNVSAGRMIYSNKFVTQSMPHEFREAPLVQSLKDKATGSSWDEFLGSKAGAVRARKPFTVSEVTPDEVVGTDDAGEEVRYTLYNHQPFNRKTSITNTPKVKAGDRVDANALIATSNFTDDNGTLAMGRNARVAVVPYLGYSMDDAIVVSQKFADKMATQKTEDYEVIPEKDVKLGRDAFVGIFQQVYDKDQLKKLDEHGVVRPGQVLREGDPIYLAHGPATVTSEQQHLGNISKLMRRRRKDLSQRWESEKPGKVTDVVKTRDGGYRVLVDSVGPLKEGGKITMRSGQKSTVSKVIPDEEMPVGEDGEPFDVILNPLSLPCYDDETEFLTTDGWVKAPDVTKDHTVATLRQDTLMMEFQRPEEVFHFPYTGKMYRLKTRQLDMMVTPNHRQFVFNRNKPFATRDLKLDEPGLGDKFKLEEAKDIFGEARKYLKASRWAGTKIKRVYIPAGTRKGNTNKPKPGFYVDGDDWVEFMAWFLSEGHTTTYLTKTYVNKRGKKVHGAYTYTIGISQSREANPDKYQDIHKLLTRMGIAHSCQPGVLVFSHKGLFEKLRPFGKCRGKYIPREILDATNKQQQLFVDTILRGDGNCFTKESTGHRQTKSYTTASDRLADGMQEICAKLGVSLNIRRGVRGCDQACHIMALKKKSPTTWVNWSKETKQHQVEEWVDYSGHVHCVTVPNGILFVRRDKKAVFSGNSRINNSLLYEILLGKVARKRGEPVKVPGFNSTTEHRWEQVQRMLEENDLSDVEKIYDPKYGRYLENPVTTGHAFVSALTHDADSKLGARSQGSYDAWEQPAKGGHAGGGAKRVGGLETAALLSAGAYDYLRDVKTVRGTKNDDFWRAVRSGRDPKEPGRPFAWDKAEAMVRGAGFWTDPQGQGVIRLGPITDKHLDSLKPVELRSGTIVDAKTMGGVSGGLFGPELTVGNRWGKVTLDYPLPNPVMEGPVKKLLGMRENDFKGMLAGGEFGGEVGPEGMRNLLSSINIDELRDEAIDQIKHGPASKRPDWVSRLNTVEGLRRNELEPKDLMIQAVPVVPPNMRPYSVLGQQFIAGDANELYKDLIELRDSQRELAVALGGPEDEHPARMYESLSALFGTSAPTNPKLKEREVTGFLKKLTGTTGKYSVFQRNLFSATVDNAGRGVAGLDPDLSMDEVGLPEEIAWEVFRPYVQRRLVKAGASPAEAIRLVHERADRARKGLEMEMKVRPVVLNRAPAWSKFSSIGALAKMHDGKSVKVNPLISTGQNLDWDGDEQICFVILKVPKYLK